LTETGGQFNWNALSLDAGCRGPLSSPPTTGGHRSRSESFVGTNATGERLGHMSITLAPGPNPGNVLGVRNNARIDRRP
jgi:hypothetical protein